ncbi:MAG: glutamate--tRNA ligase [Euryarchaeota archaeon CG01_land_8_20_14_3_00_38_12]|nr:MAG: glutamate--tRNA ligase [Euryarchaeota archaeon CG01_land_8_20_14_3_00_38_12]PJB21915.1 MAG: glutamate--tRNA ligase [Euryarchaeota archaeon CG_4_9_14_3_um_filter_38_12]
MIESARKYALQNAVLHNGKAEIGSVINKIVAEKPELKQKIKEIVPEIKKIVSDVNKLSLEEQRKELEKTAPELLIRHKKEKEKGLPELKNVSGKVVLRFAPGPSGPLHIGHSRAAILNDEYAKKYDGKFILRIEDTDPDRIDPDAYKMISEDLKWLGVNVHEIVIQSERFETYYKYAKKLLEKGNAYVCRCRPEDWRKLKLKNKPCLHRNLEPEKNLEEWEKMLNNVYGEEEASVVVKTDLTLPNPALRDFVGLRISKTLHPRTKDRYIVYPLMNFSVAVDDRLLGLTHVLRGKDHLNNTYRQAYLFDYFGWEKPEYIHYGRVSIEDVKLKTSLIKEEIKKGFYSGWDDIRLATIRALAKRGISPEAIRKYWVDVGVKPVDIMFSWKNLYAFNKDIIDKKANRYFFVWNPQPLNITGAERLEGHAPLHPDIPERGIRKIILEKPVNVFVSDEDLNKINLGNKLRLKDLCNVELISKNTGKYIGQDISILKEGAGIIHWVSKGIKTKVFFPDGSVKEGIAEEGVKKEIGSVVQFERFGFVRIDRMNDELVCYFAHK